ncbi:unnamed protein product [Anisakis simplex]|uniref:J domain-containing protein n=1 Tax=Anisakis simplex TaxID=6269 RepID=A0A0M3J5K6_ANISI|nr:unnamed protein product [Anisakis simplex]
MVILRCYLLCRLDHYKVLGVDQKATQTEIKNAYYKKCKLLHPDSGANNISAEEREKMHRLFVELKEAYDILRRPADRRIYDEKLSGQYMRYGPQNQRSSASHRRHYYHGYGPPPQYEGQGRDCFISSFQNRDHHKINNSRRDWRMFWENATGYKAEHMTAEEIRLRNQRQWSTIMRYTLIGLGIVLVYNIGYLMLVFRRDRRLDSLVAKDEIAKSFLRQREFAHQRDDPKHVNIILKILRYYWCFCEILETFLMFRKIFRERYRKERYHSVTKKILS